MHTQLWTRLVIVAGTTLALCGAVVAQQPGRAAMPSAGMRGGARMASPAPRMSLPAPRMSSPSGGMNMGRSATLLNRSGSMLPPSTRFTSPGMGNGNASNGRPSLPRGAFNGRFDDGDGTGVVNGAPNDGPMYYDRRGGVPEGTHIDGSVNDDNFRLRWHIGAGGHHPDNCFPKYCYPRHCYPYSSWPYYGLGWGWGWGYYDNYPQYVYSGPWYGTDPFVTSGTTTPAASTSQGAGAATQPPRELTPIELADLAWQADNLPDAVRYFKEYLAGAPDDADAMRFLAVALMDQRELDEAVALMALAYEKMPQLASRPLPASDIPGGKQQMRRRVNLLSAYANRTKTGSAWLALTVLVQAEGRENTAEPLVERARKAGLSEKVATELAAALSN